MKNIISLMLIAAIAAALSPLSCTKLRSEPVSESGDKGNNKGNMTDKKAAIARDGKGGKESSAISVKVATVDFKIVPRTVSITAILSGTQQADVYSKVTGRISEILKKEGEPIKKGDILFRVDRSDPGESFLNAPVVSPINGWVGRWMVTNIGEQISPQIPVVTVVDDTSLRATVFLPAEYWLLIKDDTPVIATISGEERRGKIVRISRAADSFSARGSATVEFPNPQHSSQSVWRSGLSARISFALEPKNRMIISSSALTMTDKGAYVYIASGDIAKKVVVKYAIVDNDNVEILEGLTAQDKLIILGSNLLSDGASIKIEDGQKEIKH